MLTTEFWRKHALGGATLILLGLIAFLWFRPPVWVEDLRRPAPALSWRTTDGVQKLADLTGKVVLVNFWGTWCPFCRLEMPAMQAFYQDWRARGFEMVTFSLDEDPAVATSYVRRQGFTFAAPAADAYARGAFGQVEQVPTSFIVDRQGVIRHRIDGQLRYGLLEELIAPLLAENDDRGRTGAGGRM